MLGVERITLTAQHYYESVQLPWTWHGSKVVPGGFLMGLAAAAAYETVTDDFSIDTLAANFLNGPDPTKLLQIRVQRLSDGGRFCTRIVIVEQDGTNMVHCTCSFVRTGAMKGPSMTHCVARRTSQTLDKITLDDLELGRTKQGPFMKFQRLPLVYSGKLAYFTSPGIGPPSILTNVQQVLSPNLITHHPTP